MLLAQISAIIVILVFLSYTFWPDMGSLYSWSDPKSQNYHPVHHHGCFGTPYVVIGRRYGLTVSNSKGWPHCAFRYYHCFKSQKQLLKWSCVSNFSPTLYLKTQLGMCSSKIWISKQKGEFTAPLRYIITLDTWGQW